MDKQILSGQVEAIIFAGGEPVPVDRISQVLELDKASVEDILDELMEKYNTGTSGINLVRIENSLQFTTNPAYIEPVRAALDLRRNMPLSQAALEVLAVVAYNQPITKAFVEQVRGVDCSGVIGSLMQKGLLEERGRLELPGRPLLYGTTELFLRCLDISQLSELPVPETKKTDMDEDDNEELQMTL